MLSADELATLCEESEAENEVLKAEILTHLETIAVREAVNEVLQAANNVLEAANGWLAVNNQMHSETIAVRENQIDELEDTVMHLREHIDELNGKIEDLANSDKEKLLARIENLEDKNEKLDYEKECAIENSQNLKDCYESDDGQTTNMKDGISKEITTLKEEKEELRVKYEDSVKKYLSNEGHIRDLENCIGHYKNAEKMQSMTVLQKREEEKEFADEKLALQHDANQEITILQLEKRIEELENKKKRLETALASERVAHEDTVAEMCDEITKLKRENLDDKELTAERGTRDQKDSEIGLEQTEEEKKVYHALQKDIVSEVTVKELREIVAGLRSEITKLKNEQNNTMKSAQINLAERWGANDKMETTPMNLSKSFGTLEKEDVDTSKSIKKNIPPFLQKHHSDMLLCGANPTGDQILFFLLKLENSGVDLTLIQSTLTSIYDSKSFPKKVSKKSKNVLKTSVAEKIAALNIGSYTEGIIFKLLNRPSKRLVGGVIPAESEKRLRVIFALIDFFFDFYYK